MGFQKKFDFQKKKILNNFLFKHRWRRMQVLQAMGYGVPPVSFIGGNLLELVTKNDLETQIRWMTEVSWWLCCWFVCYCCGFRCCCDCWYMFLSTKNELEMQIRWMTEVSLTLLLFCLLLFCLLLFCSLLLLLLLFVFVTKNNLEPQIRWMTEVGWWLCCCFVCYCCGFCCCCDCCYMLLSTKTNLRRKSDKWQR